jgi:hypothetical protein
MRRSWFPILSVVLLLGLLVLLATLQYRWLGQISDGEREHLQKRLQTDTQRFADDFNEELRGAYFTFQIDPGDWLEKDWTEFNKRYELWLSKTKYPQLIKDIYFVGKDSTPIRYDAKAQKFEPGEWTENLSKVREKINDSREDIIMRPTVLDSYTLLMANRQKAVANGRADFGIRRRAFGSKKI